MSDRLEPPSPPALRRRTRGRAPRCHGRGLHPGNRDSEPVRGSFPVQAGCCGTERQRSRSRAEDFSGEPLHPHPPTPLPLQPSASLPYPLSEPIPLGDVGCDRCKNPRGYTGVLSGCFNALKKCNSLRRETAAVGSESKGVVVSLHHFTSETQLP